MPHHTNNLIGLRVLALDTIAGTVRDIYFDDQNWLVHYFLVDINDLIQDKLVLIPPLSVGVPDGDKGVLPVSMTSAKITNAPAMQTDLPISKQYETALRRYYEWPLYRGEDALEETADIKNGQSNAEGTQLPGDEEDAEAQDSDPGTSEQQDEEMAAQAALFSLPREPDEQEIIEMEFSDPNAEQTFNPRLRSLVDTIGYTIESSDGESGAVEDMLIDDSEWIIRYLVVNTTLLPDHKRTLLSLHWIHDISWAMSRIYVTLKLRDILNSPPYTPLHAHFREYEKQLFDYYDQLEY